MKNIVSKKGQGLPIQTVVLIVVGMAVLIGLIAFFLMGMQKGQSDVSSFQCQQMCGTIQTMIQLKQMCCTVKTSGTNIVCDVTTCQSCLSGIATINNFCSGKCDSKITCSLPIMDNGCGYNTVRATSACLKCNSISKKPTVSEC